MGGGLEGQDAVFQVGEVTMLKEATLENGLDANWSYLLESQARQTVWVQTVSGVGSVLSSKRHASYV